MSSTAFQRITDGLKAALVSGAPVAGGAVFKNRLRALSASQNSAVVLAFKSAAGLEISLGATDWTSEFEVECYGRATAAAADPTDTADALLAAVWPRLVAASMPGLAVMQIAANPNIIWQDADAETPMSCASFRLVVLHRTASNSLLPLV